MNHCNSYIEFNNWISNIIYHDSDINFDEIIQKISALPIPDNKEKYEKLIESGFCYSLGKLAIIIGNMSKMDLLINQNKLDKEAINYYLNYYLDKVWEIWKKYCLIFGWEIYVSVLIRSEQYKKKELEFTNNLKKINQKKAPHPYTKSSFDSKLSKNSILDFNHEDIDLLDISFLGCDDYVYASEKLGNELVFEQIWRLWKNPGYYQTPIAWLRFIKCAGELKRADILKEIWESFKISHQTIDKITLLYFLVSAQNSNLKEIIQYAEALNTPSYWDLSSRHGITLDLILSGTDSESFKTRNKKRSQTFEALFWESVIKGYFDDNTLEIESLFSAFKQQIKFPEKNLDDWISTICLVQETYAREVRSRLYEELNNQLSYIEKISDERVLSEIKSGNVSIRIKKYQIKVSQIINPTLSSPLTNESFDKVFLTFIDFLLLNHMKFFRVREHFYQWQNYHESRFAFTVLIEDLFIKHFNTQNFSDQKWINFIYLLIDQIKKNVGNLFSNLFLGEVHSMKRIFVDKFEKPIQNIDLSVSNKYKLVVNARKYLKDFSEKLPKYRIMKPNKVNITPEINHYLVKDFLNVSKSIFEIPESFYIAGYDGITEDYLIPIFLEIRSNAKRALSRLSKDERQYQVILKKGKENYSEYGILSVINSFIKNNNDSVSDTYSTGTGLKNIQDYATYFQLGNRKGWAQYQFENGNGIIFFKAEIYLPLWEELSEEKFNNE